MRCDTQLWATRCRIFVSIAVKEDIIWMSSNFPKLDVQLEIHYSYGSDKPKSGK